MARPRGRCGSRRAPPRNSGRAIEPDVEQIEATENRKEPQPDHHDAAPGEALACRWKQEMERDHLSQRGLAERRSISESRVRKYPPLIFLGPHVLRRALSGELPQRITLQNLLDAAEHLDWQRQEAYLGLDR